MDKTIVKATEEGGERVQVEVTLKGTTKAEAPKDI